MRAIKTFCIGAFVLLLSIVQLILTGDPVRIVGIGIGLFFVIFGWKIGWTRNRNFTVLLGHIAVTLGCLVTAYGLYQIPFITRAPSFFEVLDLPIFWGLFTIFGGQCMITHAHCACAIRMHEANQLRKKA